MKENQLSPKRPHKKLYLLNVSSYETSVYKKNCSRVETLDTFEQLPKADKNSLILVEDIINMSKTDEQHLRKSLNYYAHHNSQKIFCVSHSIYKNSMWSLLSFFHFIIFTSAISNTPVIRFTLNYFKIEKPQVDLWLSKFKSLGAGKKGVYFYFDCVKLTFNLSENTSFTKLKNIGIAGTVDAESVSLDLKVPLQQKFETFLDGFHNKAQASAIFSILLNCLDIRLIRSHDLSFAFKSKNPSIREVRFSVVDYITVLLTREARVTRPLRAFHNYIQQYCHVPVIFKINKYLQ